MHINNVILYISVCINSFFLFNDIANSICRGQWNQELNF